MTLTADPRRPLDDTGGLKVLTYRVGELEEALKASVGEMRDACKSIDRSLQGFSSLQSQYGDMRAAVKKTWADIDKVVVRLHAVEMELPTLRLVRSWVIGGVLSVVGTLAAAVVALVLR